MTALGGGGSAQQTVDSSGNVVYGGWLDVHWAASCPPPPAAAGLVGNNWYVNYAVVGPDGHPPLTTGTSPAGGSKNINGEDSASGTFETFAFIKPGLASETFHETVSLTCFNPDLTDATHPNGDMQTTTIGGATFTLYKGPEKKKPESAIDGTVEAVSGCGTGTCSLNPQAGVSISASGSSGSGSATTGADGSYSITIPQGTYTVIPSYQEHAFTPPSQTVTVGSSHATANFKTCSAISTTIYSTMQRSGVAAAAASPVKFQQGSLKNFVRIVYTPCLTSSATVTVAWQVRPQCEAGGSTVKINPYTKKYWPQYWQLAKSGDGPYALDKNNHVDLRDHSGVLVMSITVAKGLGSATVETYNGSPALLKQLPNKINGAGGLMSCVPQAERLILKPH